jgi:hypothetical protein
MKYFTREYWKAVDVEVDSTEEQRQQAFLHYKRTGEAYFQEVDELQPRLSKPAWIFFRWGYAETGLHDAILLALTLGDGLDYKPDGITPYRLKQQRTLARINFLNYTQKYHYTFELRGLKRTSMEIFADENSTNNSLGYLSTYELTAIDDEYLRLGLLFASGNEIGFDFRKLVFKRQNLKRKYAVGKCTDEQTTRHNQHIPGSPRS